MPSDVQVRAAVLLDPTVTAFDAVECASRDWRTFDAGSAEARALGVECQGGMPFLVAVTDPTRPVGTVRVHASAPGVMLAFDNRVWSGTMFANVRILGADTGLLFEDIGGGDVILPQLFLRSSSQFLFWGRGATAVGLSVELEGIGQALVVGDDALISQGVWIRNHDMHAIHDLRTGARIGRDPVDTVLERHVWLGQDAMLHGCERIGMGTIVGARSFVKGRVPPRVAVGGVPARILRETVSWGRSSWSMTDEERAVVGATAFEAGPAS